MVETLQPSVNAPNTENTEGVLENTLDRDTDERANKQGDLLRIFEETTNKIKQGYSEMQNALNRVKTIDLVDKAKGGFRMVTGAAAISLMVACSSGEAKAETPTPTPVVQPVNGKDTPTPFATTPVKQKPVNVTGKIVSSTTESNKPVTAATPSPEASTVSTISGESANASNEVVEDSQEINFNLPSSEEMAEGPVVIMTQLSGAKSITFSSNEFTGNLEIPAFDLTLTPEEVQRTYKLGEQLALMLEYNGYKLSQGDKEKLNKHLTIYYIKTQNGTQGFKFEIPNEDLIVSSAQGSSFILNPYKNIGVDRLLSFTAQSVDGENIDIVDATLTNSEGETTDLTENAGGVSQAPKPSTKTVVINSGDDATTGTNGSESETVKTLDASTEVTEENVGNINWESIDWKPDEEVSAEIWLDDMVKRGYIRFDNVAIQYGGDKLDKLKEKFLIVPIPKEYFETGRPFYGNVYSILDSIEEEGRGHITIETEAYESLPQGAGAYAKGK